MPTVIDVLVGGWLLVCFFEIKKQKIKIEKNNFEIKKEIGKSSETNEKYLFLNHIPKKYVQKGMESEWTDNRDPLNRYSILYFSTPSLPAASFPDNKNIFGPKTKRPPTVRASAPASSVIRISPSFSDVSPSFEPTCAKLRKKKESGINYVQVFQPTKKKKKFFLYFG